jgi:DNA-binding MarR family transcriptional regulator
MPRDTSPSDNDVDMAGLDGQVGFALRLAQVAVFNDLISALKACDLRVTDFSVLLLIGANPGISQQAIGEALRIQRPNLVSIIDALQQKDLVRRETVPQDRRSYALSLTGAGTKLLTRAKAAHQRHTRKVSAAVGPHQDVVLAALKRIAEI